MKRKVKGNNEEEMGVKIKKIMYPFIDGSTYKLQVSVLRLVW
jgi:hypothetical protein